MRVTLNFATRPYANSGPAIKRLRVTMAVLAVVAITMGLVLHALHRNAEAMRARNHSLDSQIARIAHERRGYQDLMRQPSNAQVLAKVQALNRLFDEKAFSWTLAMEDLETVLPARVQVSNLEPTRSKDGRITLHMRVIGPRDRGLELVSNLEHSRRFALPSIVGENTESAGGPNESPEPVSLSNRVNFDLLAEYNPATAAERKADIKPASQPDHSKNLQALNHPAPFVRPPSVKSTSKNVVADTPAAHRATEPAVTDPGLAGSRPPRRPSRPYPGLAAPTATGMKPNLSPGGLQ